MSLGTCWLGASGSQVSWLHTQVAKPLPIVVLEDADISCLDAIRICTLAISAGDNGLCQISAHDSCYPSAFCHGQYEGFLYACV